MVAGRPSGVCGAGARLVDMVVSPHALVESASRLRLHSIYYITKQVPLCSMRCTPSFTVTALTTELPASGAALCNAGSPVHLVVVCVDLTKPAICTFSSTALQMQSKQQAPAGQFALLCGGDIGVGT